VIARTGVSGKYPPNSPEKLPLLITLLTCIHVGNTASRYALAGLIPAYACAIAYF